MATKKKEETVETKANKKASKAQDKVTAEKIEAKKTVRGAGRKMTELKDAAKNQAEDIREAVVAHKIEDKKNVRNAKRTMKGKAEAARNQAEDIREAVVAHKIEDKKNIRKAASTVKTTAKNASIKMEKSIKTPAKVRQAVKLNVVIQSPMGGSITADEIAAKLPKGTTDVYVKIEENKLYWVKKDGETGSVEIW